MVNGADLGSWTGILEINSSSSSGSGLGSGSGSGSDAGVRGEFGMLDRDSRDSLGGRTTVSIGVIWRMVKDEDDRGEDLGIDGVEDFRASAYDRK